MATGGPRSQPSLVLSCIPPRRGAGVGVTQRSSPAGAGGRRPRPPAPWLSWLICSCPDTRGTAPVAKPSLTVPAGEGLPGGLCGVQIPQGSSCFLPHKTPPHPTETRTHPLLPAQPLLPASWAPLDSFSSRPRSPQMTLMGTPAPQGHYRWPRLLGGSQGTARGLACAVGPPCEQVTNLCGHRAVPGACQLSGSGVHVVPGPLLTSGGQRASPMGHEGSCPGGDAGEGQSSAG